MRKIQKIKSHLFNHIPYDERLKFHDLSKIRIHERKPQSDVLNFYSSIQNVGNYTPLLGIHQMLGQELDTWCVHDKNIDWNFINSNYKGIIVGGAGLFHAGFEGFWRGLIVELKIPFIVWGVGGIFPKNRLLLSNVSSKILKEACHNADLVNVRDNLSANLIDFEKISIAACPTIVYMDTLRDKVQKSLKIMYSSHEELLSDSEKIQVRNFLKEKDYIFNDNIQKKFFGMTRVMQKYLSVNHVITTRLHGAIIAYGLGIPYTAISYDDKIDEFHRLYGNGRIIDGPQGLIKDCLDQNLDYKLKVPETYNAKLFGNKALLWKQSLS